MSSSPVFESLLNHSFNIARRQRTPDGQGGHIIEYMQISPVNGRLRPATSRERETALLEERVITHVFYCFADQDLTRGDMITPGVFLISGSEILASDIMVKIEGIREPSTNDHHFEIDCVEYQRENAAQEAS